MDERTLQNSVFSLLRARPELIWHACGRALHCSGHAGMPDILIIGMKRVIFRELKGDFTPLKRHQRDYGDALMQAGMSWSVWRSEDLASGRIERELEELR